MNRLPISFLLFTFLCFPSLCKSQHSEQVNEALEFINSQMYTDLDSSLKVCEQALSIVEPESAEYAKILARQAVIYDIKGETEKAVSGLLAAIKIQKKHQDSTELSYSYNNLGISYFYTYRYDEALKYYHLSAEIDSLQKNLSGWSGTMINTAIIYSNTNQFDKAQSIYDMVLDKMESSGDSSLTGTLYSNSAKLYVLTAQFDKALEKINRARPYILTENDPSPKMTLEVSTSNTLLRLGRFDEALVAAKRGLNYDPDSVYTERRIHLYECLSRIYYAKTMIDSGDYYNAHYQAIRDSLFNIETQSKVEEIQVQYEVAEYKLEQEKLKTIASQEAQAAIENKAQRNLFIAIAVFFILIGLLLSYRNRLKKTQQLVLKEQLKLQEQLVVQKEAFIGEIHHRVKNNLQLVASMLAIQSSQHENSEVKSVFEASKNRIDAMSLIHQKLYQATDFEHVNIGEYIQNLCEKIVVTYAAKQTIKSHYEISTLELHIDTIVPLGLILNELITNSIKYAFNEVVQPKITIQIYEKDNRLVLNYLDNGNGFTGQKQKGFGSHLLHSLSRQLKGQIEEDTNNGYNFQLKMTKYKKIQ